MPSPATPDEPTAEPTVEKDDVKRRFKEALDRKQGRASDATTAGDGGDHAKVHGGAHGPASQQRQFRRKSG